jgi:hypothetical protein
MKAGWLPAEGIGLRTDKAGRPVVTGGLGSFLREIAPPVEERLEPFVLVGMIPLPDPPQYTGQFGYKPAITPRLSRAAMTARQPRHPRVPR